jgi:predicted ABC-type ATPase
MVYKLTKTLLKEKITHKNFGPMMDNFVSFACDHLKIRQSPKINYISNNPGEQPSFGGYHPEKNEISVLTRNRHPIDIFRTIAHELVHHKQNLDGRIKDVALEGSTGSDIENEANSEAGKLMRWYGKANPEQFNLTSVNESYHLQEGVFDRAHHTAVFLAGGPGSGKDFIMNRTLRGHGLRELNSDNAFEYLMDKHNFDKTMPDSQNQERNLIRGRAKNITKEKQRLIFANRQGLIINGTADDPDKIVLMKKHLENLGYKTMMMMVHTKDRISKDRNIARGLQGGRMVPEDIRKEKWIKSQESKPLYNDIFGDNILHIDNNDDLSKISTKRKKELDQEHLNIFKHVHKFTGTTPENEKTRSWISKESGQMNYKQPRSYNMTVPVHQSKRLDNTFKKFIKEEGGAGDEGTTKLKKRYIKDTPGEVDEDNTGIGPEFSTNKTPSIVGGGFSENIEKWAKNPKTLEKYRARYGVKAEQKIQEAMSSIRNIKSKITK